MDIKSENVSENHKSVYTRLGRSLPEGASQFLGWRRRRGGKMKRLVFKPFRRSKAIAISSAHKSPAPRVSSPRQRSAGRGLRRGEIANSQSDQRTITNPKRSVPPLPGPRHQWRLMRRESGAVGLWRFIKIQTRRLRGTLPKTEMRPFASKLRAEPKSGGQSQLICQITFWVYLANHTARRMLHH